MEASTTPLLSSSIFGTSPSSPVDVLLSSMNDNLDLLKYFGVHCRKVQLREAAPPRSCGTSKADDFAQQFFEGTCTNLLLAFGFMHKSIHRLFEVAH